MKNKKVLFSKPDIQDKELKNVSKILKSGWLTHGEYTKNFEEKFAKYTKSSFSTTVSSCTAGLHLSCLALGIQKGDEVIVPAMTHTATAHAVEYTGAKPVFADVDYETGNIKLSEIKKKINSRTKLVIPVHMAGNMCNMEAIKKLLIKKNIKIIEDCAHSLGSTLNNKHAGNFGETGNFSFYPTKQLTTGEGGMVISNNKKLIEKIIKLKQFGIDTPIHLRKKPGLYNVQHLGFNYRLTDFQAAIGLGQLERYNKNLLKRKQNAQLYSKILKKSNNIRFHDFNKDCSYFIFQILCDSSKFRDKLILNLKKKQIGFAIHYATPVPYMKYYMKKYNFSKSLFPNSSLYSKTAISLPTHSYLKKDQINYICNSILEVK